MKKAILITGTTNGIGENLKKHFLSKGNVVIGVDKEIDSYTHDNYQFIHVDLADDDALRMITLHVADQQLFSIVNNAGEFAYNPFEDFDVDRFNRSHLVNATMPLVLASALKDNLVEGESTVINITSGDAYFAGHEDLGYASSKASLSNITKSMAAALGPKNIRVNAIAPGWVDTSMADNAGIEKLAHDKTPLGRNATTQEIADLVNYLMSSKSSFINGAIINIDGGYTMIDNVVKQEFDNHRKENK